LLQVEQHSPGGDRRQLGRITHQHQPGLGGKGLQQRRHQVEIDHRDLIHHQQIEGEGVAAVAGEMVAAAFQQPVQGAAGIAAAGGSRQAAGGFAGGGRQVEAGGGILRQDGLEHPGHGAGLTGARPPLEQHQPLLEHRRHGLALARIEAGRGRRSGVGNGGGMTAGLDPLQQGREHGRTDPMPAPPADLSFLDHQRPIRSAAERGGGQGRGSRPLGQGNGQLALLQGLRKAKPAAPPPPGRAPPHTAAAGPRPGPPGGAPTRWAAPTLAGDRPSDPYPRRCRWQAKGLI
jgi:hypothetical protein